MGININFINNSDHRPYQVPLRRRAERQAPLQEVIGLRDVWATAVPVVLGAQIRTGGKATTITAARARERRIVGLQGGGCRRSGVLEVIDLVESEGSAKGEQLAPVLRRSGISGCGEREGEREFVNDSHSAGALGKKVLTQVHWKDEVVAEVLQYLIYGELLQKADFAGHQRRHDDGVR